MISSIFLSPNLLKQAFSCPIMSTSYLGFTGIFFKDYRTITEERREMRLENKET